MVQIITFLFILGLIVTIFSFLKEVVDGGWQKMRFPNQPPYYYLPISLVMFAAGSLCSIISDELADVIFTLATLHFVGTFLLVLIAVIVNILFQNSSLLPVVTWRSQAFAMIPECEEQIVKAHSVEEFWTSITIEASNSAVFTSNELLIEKLLSYADWCRDKFPQNREIIPLISDFKDTVSSMQI